MTNRLYTGKPEPCFVCKQEFKAGEKSKAIQTKFGFRRVHLACAVRYRAKEMGGKDGGRKSKAG